VRALHFRTTVAEEVFVSQTPTGRVLRLRVPAMAAATTAAVAAWLTAAASAAPASGLEGGVLELALRAAACAVRAGDVANPETLTVIDYSKPSTAKRLWVVDLDTREVIFEELVAHGQGSGGNLATAFSNLPDSHQTSLGLFVTGESYVGKNGYSLRLDGLDRGFNDRARERAIVMHGAPYVSPEVAKTQGRLGRSWGCPAVSDAVARPLIDLVKDGDLVFAYYPDREWLRSSAYLGDCAAASD
jgi:hypothetical protein